MKKNVMLKIAAVLLVAVLLSTCAISATFAKYSSSSGLQSDTARVARWGVDAAVTVDGGFGSTYVDGNKFVTSSNGSDKILAPGTNGVITITPSVDASEAEVSYEVIYEATIQLNGVPLVFTDTNDEPIADIETYLETQAAQAVEQGNSVTVKWSWPFYTNDDADAVDNDLGNAEDLAEVVFSFKIDVVQTGSAGAKE